MEDQRGMYEEDAFFMESFGYGKGLPSFPFPQALKSTLRA